MTHGSLFSGIGGFDLAAEWMGWENIFHCEWNAFGQRVLKYYWPDAISYNDITKTDFTIHRGRIDILTGGFPCQPYSMAGKRLGKEDDRHLWPEMLRAIREIQPRWVVGENVLGLVNWSDGLVFHEVQADLEAEGYEVQPYVLPAVSVNAPHRRDRVWFVANANGGATGTPREGRSIKSNWSGDNVQQSERREQTEQHNRSSSFSWDAADTNGIGRDNGSDNWRERQVPHDEERSATESKSKRGRWVGGIGQICCDGDATDTNGVRLEQRKNSGEMGVRQTKICGAGGEFADATQTNGAFSDAADTDSDGVQGFSTYSGTSQNVRQGRQGFEKVRHNRYASGWEGFPTVAPVCDGNDGISDRLDGITFSKWRQESIKAGGNAVVPQVVLQIFRTIEEYEKMNTQ